MFAINRENLKTLNYHIFFKKQVFSLFAVTVVINMKKVFKEILKILGLITNKEEYQKLYNHV